VSRSGKEIAMQSLQLDDLELVEGWSDDDPKLRGRFDFPVHAETGAASTSVVYFEVPPGSHCGRHTHSAEEILLILDGSVEAEVDGERGRLEAGGIALIPAFAPHDVHNVGGVPYRAVGVFSSAAVVSKFESAIQPLGTNLIVVGAPQENGDQATA
jgi:quercetin dioxygenase-like cupin family protein